MRKMARQHARMRMEKEGKAAHGLNKFFKYTFFTKALTHNKYFKAQLKEIEESGSIYGTSEKAEEQDQSILKRFEGKAEADFA